MTAQIPTSKTIVWPIWRDTTIHYWSYRDVVGMFARWAICQSPYPLPENLEDACTKLYELLEKHHPITEKKDLGLMKLTLKQLDVLLEKCFDEMKILEVWNTPKIIGSDYLRGWVAVSRYWDVDPDRDFIDIDALRRNIVMELTKIACLDAD